jgi:hypothetical protein
MSLGARLFALLLGGWLGLIADARNDLRVMAEPSTGDEVDVATDINGALELARKALAAGRPELAQSIASQIIAAEPDNASAHMILAAALTRSHRTSEAFVAAKTGFRLSDGREENFESAYLAAEAAALSGRPLVAKYWLRRADSYAPTQRHSEVIAKAYHTVSAQSRLDFGFSVFGGPSDNVNGGSLHDTFWFYGIPIPITQALPGTMIGSAMQGGYQLDPTMRVWLGWTHQDVLLGAAARAIYPDARAQDYRRDEVRLGLSKDWQNGSGTSGLHLDVSSGRQWLGGTEAADIAEAKLMARYLASENWALGAKISVEDARGPERSVSDRREGRLTFSASTLDQKLGAATFEIGLADVASQAAGVAWSGPVAALGWKPRLHTDWFELKFDFALEQRTYWLTPEFRPDLMVGASVTAEVNKLAVMGFNPTITVSSTRTLSEVVVRDTQEIGISFGLSSRF